MRKKLYVLLAISIIFFVAACANNDNAGEDGSSGDIVTLDLWNRYPELRGPFDELISNFEEEHPNIKINKQDLPLDSHEAQLQTAVSSGDLPDMFTTAVELVTLVENDSVKNLDEVFTEEVRNEFYEGTWWENGTTLNDSVYVFPFKSPQSGLMSMMYYNIDVLEQLGISEDEIPTSWDEFIAIGERILDESDGSIAPLAWNNEGWTTDRLASMMATAITPENFDFFNYKEGEPAYTSDGLIESAEFLKKLFDDGIMAPNSVEVGTMDAEAHFAVGANAFWISGSWTGNQLINDHNFENWGVTTIPTKDGKPYYFPAASETDGLQVNNDTEHWEEVKVFLEYALENLHEILYVNTGLGVPAKMGVEGEYAFEQQADIAELEINNVIQAPKPGQINFDTIQFEKDFNSALDIGGVGDAIIGYLSGNVANIETELEEMDEEAKELFSKKLEEDENVSREDFIFENWVPFEPFVEEDYEELAE